MLVWVGDNKHTVMEYDIGSGKWTTLPYYTQHLWLCNGSD